MPFILISPHIKPEVNGQAVSQRQEIPSEETMRSGGDQNILELSANRPGNRFREEKKSDWTESDGRWFYLLGVAERMSAIRREDGREPDRILDSIESNLIGLGEVFPKETDPVSDLQGYAVRRFSQEILRIIHTALMPKRERNRSGIVPGLSGGTEVKAP